MVREKLGSGGFGAVYRAEQPLLAREAVIKVLHSKARAKEEVIQRFLREARLASKLDHPAHIYAFGAEADGLLWIAMELVRGTPLDKLLKAQGPVPLPRLVPLIERICEVVHAAHEQGVIHRDLKPANVMVLARAGRFLPKLHDFGIAKLRGERDEGAEPAEVGATTPPGGVPALHDAMAESALAQIEHAQSMHITRRGLLVGSPHYMAPEQWLNAGDADARTDIYALGVLAYQCLTGRLPFDGRTLKSIARQHATGVAPPLPSELPQSLNAVFVKALAKRAPDRYATALELAAAFRAASQVEVEPDALPRLDDSVRDALLAEGPQPIAEAVALLEAARSPKVALERIRLLLRTTLRYVGVLALSARARVGPGAAQDSPETLRLLSSLRRGALSDSEWLQLSTELCRPFAARREAHPIPELVSLLVDPSGVPRESCLRAALAEAPRSADPTAESIRSVMTQLSRLLGRLSFLVDYRLVLRRGELNESWSGARRSPRATVPVVGALAEGQPSITDREGVPLLMLWPLAQVHAPTHGASEELFLLSGEGRYGGRQRSHLGFADRRAVAFDSDGPDRRLRHRHHRHDLRDRREGLE